MNKADIICRDFFELDTQDLQNILFDAYKRGFNRALDRLEHTKVQITNAY